MRDALLLLGFVAFYGLSMASEWKARQELLNQLQSTYTELQQCRSERVKQ